MISTAKNLQIRIIGFEITVVGGNQIWEKTVSKQKDVVGWHFLRRWWHASALIAGQRNVYHLSRLDSLDHFIVDRSIQQSACSNYSCISHVKISNNLTRLSDLNERRGDGRRRENPRTEHSIVVRLALVAFFCGVQLCTIRYLLLLWSLCAEKCTTDIIPCLCMYERPKHQSRSREREGKKRQLFTCRSHNACDCYRIIWAIKCEKRTTPRHFLSIFAPWTHTFRHSCSANRTMHGNECVFARIRNFHKFHM